MNKKYVLRKIENNHERLRDSTIECFECSEPTLGQCLILTAPSKDFSGGIRVINTSPLTEIEKVDRNTIVVKTRSGSTYRVETLWENEV